MPSYLYSKKYTTMFALRTKLGYVLEQVFDPPPPLPVRRKRLELQRSRSSTRRASSISTTNASGNYWVTFTFFVFVCLQLMEAWVIPPLVPSTIPIEVLWSRVLASSKRGREVWPAATPHQAGEWAKSPIPPRSYQLQVKVMQPN